MMEKLIFLRSQPKACHYGARISDRRRACAISVSEWFYWTISNDQPWRSHQKSAYTTYWTLPPDHHTAADYLRQFDLLVLNFISRGNFVILPRLWNNSEVHRWFVNKDPNLNTAILDITDSELKEDLLQSLMDSLGSNKHVLPEVCICFLSLLAEQESPHFQDFFYFSPICYCTITNLWIPMKVIWMTCWCQHH